MKTIRLPPFQFKVRRAAIIGLSFLLGFPAVFGLSGCGSKKAGNATEAIERAKLMHTPQEQSDYLLAQAHAFLSDKDYQEAAKTVQYVLSSVDASSTKAQQLLDETKRRLASDTQAAIGDAGKKMGL